MKNQYINSVILRHERVSDFSKYPFNIPVMRNFTELTLHDSVTFFVGENGSGKSTLLEAIAVAYGFNAEGGSRNFNFTTYNSTSTLSDCLTLSKGVIRRY